MTSYYYITNKGNRMKKSDLRKIIKEEILRLIEYDQHNHSLMRLYNITMKETNPRKITQLINNRTDKITNIQKLKSWIDVLEDENYHIEAEYAREKLNKMGYRR